jgi:general secretion pathway protein J
MRSKFPSPGFTLIELLVAITILAIVAVLGWRGLDSIMRSRDVLTAELEQTRGLQLTFAQLQSDCSENVNPLSYPNIPEGRTSWIEPQRFILIRNSYIEDQAPAMQVVVYRVRDGNLMRFESDSTRDLAELKQFLDMARNPPDNQGGIVMQKNVQAIEFAGYPENVEGASTEDDKNSEGRNPPNPNNPPPDPNNPPPGPNNPPPNPNNPPGQKQSEFDVKDNLQKVNQNSVTTGLQVSLQLPNNENKIVKIFLLGGA